MSADVKLHPLLGPSPLHRRVGQVKTNQIPLTSSSSSPTSLSSSAAAASSSPASFPSSSPYPRSFAPTPPFLPPPPERALYSKPGFFLTPQNSPYSRQIPLDMWLYKGTTVHYVCLAVALLIAFILLAVLQSMNEVEDEAVVNWRSSVTSIAETDDYAQLDVHQALRSLLQLQPTRGEKDGVEFYWQRSTPALREPLMRHPHIRANVRGTDQPSSGVVGEAKAENGLVLLFHGCSHSASDWFFLPEDRRIVRFLLASSYSVIAFTSIDRESGCWDNTWPLTAGGGGGINHDVTRIIPVLSSFVIEHLSTDPQSPSPSPALFTMGASSGGTFTSIISRALPIVAQIISISPGNERALLTVSSKPFTEDARPSPLTYTSSALSSVKTLFPLPPTTFLHMPVDQGTAGRIHYLAEQLKNKGRALGLRQGRTESVLIKDVKPVPLTRTFLAEKIDAFYLPLIKANNGRTSSGSLSSHAPLLDPASPSSEWAHPASEQFYLQCHRESFIDQYGYIKDDPRESGMLAYLRDWNQREEQKMKAEKGSWEEDAVKGEEEGPMKTLGDLLQEHYLEVEEEMNILHASHEMTSAYIDEIAWWMERQRTGTAQ